MPWTRPSRDKGASRTAKSRPSRQTTTAARRSGWPTDFPSAAKAPREKTPSTNRARAEPNPITKHRLHHARPNARRARTRQQHEKPDGRNAERCAERAFVRAKKHDKPRKQAHVHPGHRDDMINAAAGKVVFQRIGQALFIARQKRDQEAFHILWKNRPARILEPPCRQRWKMAKDVFSFATVICPFAESTAQTPREA